MKSSKEDLIKRGYIDDVDIKEYENIGKQELMDMVNSKISYKRTIGIRILNKGDYFEKEELHNILVDKLVLENSLYTKLEICKVLENANNNTLIKMFKSLGKVGSNQYKNLPESSSKKKSYPLPRDIIARIIGHMNISVLEVLIEEMNKCGIIEVRELIDAIGFICFYNKVDNKENLVVELTKCYEKYKHDEIIRWKVVTAFSSFDTESSILKLEEIRKVEKVKVIRSEAKRSLELIRAKTKYK